MSTVFSRVQYTLRCQGCMLPIAPGEDYFTVLTGYLDDLVTSITEITEPFHTFCIDPYDLILSLADGESVAVTLHQRHDLDK